VHFCWLTSHNQGKI